MSELNNLKLVLADYYEILTGAGRENITDVDRRDRHEDLCGMWLSLLMREIDGVQAKYPLGFVINGWNIIDDWGEFSEKLEAWLSEHLGEPGSDWVCVGYCVERYFRVQGSSQGGAVPPELELKELS